MVVWWGFGVWWFDGGLMCDGLGCGAKVIWW